MDVPDNVIMELKDNEHKEPSVTGKVTNYFNMFECGRNLLDQLDVMYQQAFMASPAQEGNYKSPEQERYYDQLTESLINSNAGSYGNINNDKLNQAINDLNAESQSGNERNINDMTQVNEYKLPRKIKMHLRSTIRNIIIFMSTKMK